MSKFPLDLVLETERCRLRFPTIDDCSFVFEAAQYSGFTDGMRWSPPESVEELHPNIEKHRKKWEKGEAFNFTIESKFGDFLGRIALDREETDWSFGYWLHPKCWGQGYMTEAAKEVLRFGFADVGCKRIIGPHAAWNEASGRVMKRCNMKWVRHIPCGFVKNGKEVPEEEYEITKEEWERLQ